MRRRNWLTRTPFAHRGLHNAETGIVENSPSAFRAAIAEGFGIELDVQLTADGKVVVFHDADLDRLTERTEDVADLTGAELEKTALKGSEDCIPTLEAVLDLIAERVALIVELKGGTGNDERLAETVAASLAGYGGEVAVMSFAPGVVAWFRDNRPGMVRGLVASTRYRRELGWRLSRPLSQKSLARDLDPDFVAYDIRSLPNAFTTDWRKDGRPLLTWTVRTQDHRLKARRFADNIIFERP